MKNNKKETKSYYTLKEVQTYIDTLNVLDNTKIYTIDVRDILDEPYKTPQPFKHTNDITIAKKRTKKIDISKDVANFIEENNYTIEENGKWIECNQVYSEYMVYTEQPDKPTRTRFTQALSKLNVGIKFKKDKERKTIRVYTNISK